MDGMEDWKGSLKRGGLARGVGKGVGGGWAV